MTNEKSILYRKAYVELYEILGILDKEQKNEIPNDFIDNISKNMDKDYKFEFDMSKGISEQDLMIETKALLVEIYERYLAPEEEKELWQKYDRLCLNKIEEDKKLKYGNNIFEDDQYAKASLLKNENTCKDSYDDEKNSLISLEKENIFHKIVRYIKEIFKIKK